MRLILFFLLLSFTSYSQLPTRLKLKQLESGPPDAILVTDSVGQIKFDTFGIGGVYSGDGTIPVGTLATVTESPGNVIDFAIGRFPSWPDANLDDTENGFYYAKQYYGSIGLISSDSVGSYSNLDMYPEQVNLYVHQEANRVEFELSPGSSKILDVTAGQSTEVSVQPGTVSLNANYTGVPGSYLTINPFNGMSLGVNDASISFLLGVVAPEGVVTGYPGNLYINVTSPAKMYLKETGNATNTGWKQLAFIP